MIRYDGEDRRSCLREAELMLLFTPELCRAAEPLEVLLELAPEVDLIQVRIKAAGKMAAELTPQYPGAPGPPAEARDSFEWCNRILSALASLPEPPPVLVDDRVDVALALRDAGCAGVHLGRHDLPVAEARRQLGADALIGISTHDVNEVVQAGDSGADYIGFGPIFATTTKGYQQGLGPEIAWVADAGSALPLFPIGGIDLMNANTLSEVGRAAASAALLGSDDPRAAARQLRELLSRSR